MRLEISDTVGRKLTYVTETVYRNVIVPAIRGGATITDDIFDDNDNDNDNDDARPRRSLALGMSLKIEQIQKSVKLRGFGPLP